MRRGALCGRTRTNSGRFSLRRSAAPESRLVRLFSERGAVIRGRDCARHRSRPLDNLDGVGGIKAVRPRRRSFVDEIRARRRPPAATYALDPEAGTCVGLHLGLDEIGCWPPTFAFRQCVKQGSRSVATILPPGRRKPRAPPCAKSTRRRGVAERVAWRRHLGFGARQADGRVQRASVVPVWAGVNIREVFEPAFERPIFADNESNCAAIAEMTWGAAVGCEDSSCSRSTRRRRRDRRRRPGAAGHRRRGGEFGHMTIDPDGELCRCGNRGCLELSASSSRRSNARRAAAAGRSRSTGSSHWRSPAMSARRG